MNTGADLAVYLSVTRKLPMNPGKHDMKIAPRPDHPVIQLTARDLHPVTRLVSETEVTVINGVLTVVRVLKAA